jgi:hypothetical protein
MIAAKGVRWFLTGNCDRMRMRHSRPQESGSSPASQGRCAMPPVRMPVGRCSRVTGQTWPRTMEWG